jgi:CubicO group peptidase (beta-lactamase class C family)
VLVTHGDKEVAYINVGMADVAKKLPISRDTIFRIYSMTKPITCVAALILVDRGIISLDDPIEKWLPMFRKQMQVYVSGDAMAPVTVPAQRSITVRDLMMHTSGFTYAFFGTHPCDKILASHFKEDAVNWLRNTPISKICEALANSPLCFEPGTKWQYGLSTDVLGHLIECAAGVSFQDFLQQEIFDKLGMVDTGFFVPEAKLPRLAECYDLRGPNNGFVRSSAIERGRSELPAFISGGGGLVSTIDDYLKFAKCLLNNGELNGIRILQEDTCKLMYQNHLPDNKDLVSMAFSEGFSETVGEGMGFGLGVSVVIDPVRGRGSVLSSVGEFGWGGAASTWVQIDPVRRIVVVFMTQAIPSAILPIRSHLRWLAHWVVDNAADV